MKKTLNAIHLQAGRSHTDSTIEVLTDESAAMIKGGDRDFTPIVYDSSVNRPSLWNRASVLMDLLSSMR